LTKEINQYIVVLQLGTQATCHLSKKGKNDIRHSLRLGVSTRKSLGL
jgi:hypothetical protein